MGVQDSGPMGRIFIRVGSEEIDLTGSDDEIISTLGKILKTDTWQSSLSKIRKARDAAIDAATKSALDAKIPERGSSFGHLLDSCGIDKTGDVILASIHYLRSVERESNTPPRGDKEADISDWKVDGGRGREVEPLLVHQQNDRRRDDWPW